MSCIKKSVCKICRRENMKLFLKGDRCFTDKCAFDRRPYPPGQHGQSRLKFSEFALQLREKQKTKRYYGVSEKQFRRYVGTAEKAKEVTGLALLKSLEQRLDNIVATLGFAASRRDAKQIVSHGHVLVNGKRVNVPSFAVSKGDVIEISSGFKDSPKIIASVQSAGKRSVPAWLEVEQGTLKGVVKDLPSREEITLPVEENMIVEYYSR